MKITRTSILTGETRTCDLDVTPEQITAWQQGELIQNVAPHLSDVEREFIMSGATAEEWDEMFGVDDEKDDVPSH